MPANAEALWGIKMVDQPHQVSDQTRSESTGCLPVILRLTWLMWGNLALFICAALVAEGTAPIVTDLLFFLVAGSLVGVRYVDITRFKGETTEGEPATIAHWRRYAIMMMLISAALWALARVAASRGWM